jgi:hypothetical protein
MSGPKATTPILKDIFAVQADIVRRAVGAVAVKLTRFEEERVRAKPTGSLVAYEYILRGREFLHIRRKRRATKRAARFSGRSLSTRTTLQPMPRSVIHISRPSYLDGRNFAVKSLSAPKRSRKRRWRLTPRQPAPTAC